MTDAQSAIKGEGSASGLGMRKSLAIGAVSLALAVTASAGVAVVNPAPVTSHALSPCVPWNDGAREMWNGKEFECKYMGAFSWEWVLVGRGGSGGRFIGAV